MPMPSSSLEQETRVSILPNGLTVLVHQDQRFPLVSVRLFVRAGSAQEPPELAGISHMVEHMVFKGSAGRGRKAARIEGAGGEINAATGFDATTFLVDVPDQSWVEALEVLRDMVFASAMDTADLESERLVVLSELDQGQDQPERMLFQAVQHAMWENTPYGRPVIGFRETVQNIRRQDVLEFIRKRYQPGAMLLVLCGNVGHAEALDQAWKIFGDLANNELLDHTQSLSVPAMTAGPRLVVEQGPWRKVHFALALPIPGLGSAHCAGLDVLAHMLGGDRTSMLYRILKHELGIVDGISASAMSLEQAGLFMIKAHLDPENIRLLWDRLISLLAGLGSRDFSPRALQRAKLNLEDGLFQARETISGLASKLGYFQFHELSVTAEQRYVHLVRGLEASHLDELIAEHIRPEGLACVLFTPDSDALDHEAMGSELRSRWTAGRGDGFRRDRPKSGEREIIQLAPGRTLALLPDDSLPYTALQMTWTGGDLLLAPEEQGLSELTARVWTKGTKSMDSAKIQDFLADRAARLGAGSGLEKFALSAHFPSRFGSEVLSLVLELIQAPAWASEELERAVKEQVAAIVRSEDHPVGLAFRRIFPFLFPGHPYGYQRSGDPQQLTGFTREQVAGFWKGQKHRPWVLSVCGDYDRQEIMDLARTVAAAGETPAIRHPAPQWGEVREMDLNLADRSQAHVFVVFPAPGLVHEHTAGLRVLREVLAGQSGVLFQDLRDAQGLAYAVSAFLWQDGLTGFLALYIGTAPDRVDAALSGFQSAVRELGQNRLSVSHLSRARNLLWGDYHRDRQPLMARAHEISDALSRGLDPDHELHVLEQARQIDARGIKDLVNAYLQWDKAYLLRVLP